MKLKKKKEVKVNREGGDDGSASQIYSSKVLGLQFNLKNPYKNFGVNL